MAELEINEINNTAESIANTDNFGIQTAANVTKRASTSVVAAKIVGDMVAQTNTFGAVQKYDATGHAAISGAYDLVDTSWVLGTGTALGYQTHLTGFSLANNVTYPNTHIDIGAGIASTSTMIRYARNTSVKVKRIDQTFLIGSGNGMMASGVALSPNTWYHIFAIMNDTTLVVDYLCDTSITCSHIPAGYDSYARIGSIKTDGSSNIVQFSFYEIGGLRKFLWYTPVLDISESINVGSRETHALTVPTGCKVEALINISVNCNTGNGTPASIYLSDLNTTDVSPSVTVAPLGQVIAQDDQYAGSFLSMNTNTSGQIGVRSSVDSTKNTTYVATLGWYDPGNKYFS